MSKTVLVIICNGVEEIEMVTPVDLFRRAKLDVTLAVVGDSLSVVGRSGIMLNGDTFISDVLDVSFDAVFLPGGPGYKLLLKSENVKTVLKEHARQEKLITAICAAPMILNEVGLLENKAFTAHFSVKDALPAMDQESSVVVDGNIVTSQGAGTSLPFALRVIGILRGDDVASQVAESICYS